MSGIVQVASFSCWYHVVLQAASVELAGSNSHESLAGTRWIWACSVIRNSCAYHHIAVCDLGFGEDHSSVSTVVTSAFDLGKARRSLEELCSRHRIFACDTSCNTLNATR